MIQAGSLKKTHVGRKRVMFIIFENHGDFWARSCESRYLRGDICHCEGLHMLQSNAVEYNPVSNILLPEPIAEI